MKVLLGWELGSGQAHIHRLAALAKMLVSMGVTPVFALKSYQVKGIDFPWVGISIPPLPFSGRVCSYTYADILETFGFGSIDRLRSQILAWKNIFKEVQPKLIVADYAPSLVLAARNSIPTVVIGGGFTVPPPVETFPILQFPAPPESFQRQEQVSDTVRKVVNSDMTLGQLLNGDSSFIYSIPELDPYRYLRERKQYVSSHITPIPNHLHRADGPCWAYLGDDYSYRQLVLQTLQPECEFKPLDKALAGKSLAIHHGSLTTSIACLLTGIPQLLLPRHLEEQLNALALSQMGVAKIVTQVTWKELLITQAQSFGLAHTAKEQADSLAYWNQNLTNTIFDDLTAFLK
ncbi:hypothetical protein F7734_04675 [Scytonema sp. UIC 10036]|uniref:hypothetical protein n=1 Tax=Scytonema sp. UIC 10036 TaxID=2304196 RepID=UPI0012DA3090|nr:hypothetical protein [Scytonema sp. UIC 10036]MUG91802.1 hypothetical protein [Scytonema sp. UIC 10036]